MRRRRIIAAAGAALLSACAPQQPDLVPRAEVLSTAAGPKEASLLARYPDRAYRKGDTLFVASRGGFIQYRSTSCEVADDCVYYGLDEAFLDGRLFGIAVGYYEGGDYIVADTQSLHQTTGEKPVFSPGGKLFATAAFNEAYETDAEGVHLWTLEYPMRLLRMISPDLLSYPQDLVWRSDQCLEFTAISGQPVRNEQGEPLGRQSWYLVEADPEWQLASSPDIRCEPKRS